ncbi:hypothetical protein SAMN05421505_1085 [Sinosporangium album]|uniref:Uncharacterized protein n=1 Tax=Sinosporangium album TaxID=504805 RepID=A0A1G7X2A5_9ACTN|nr:hypothetical protein SAMN05421505_1085 [Sinosporangium album]
MEAGLTLQNNPTLIYRGDEDWMLVDLTAIE